jgi:hypothetical protein
VKQILWVLVLIAAGFGAYKFVSGPGTAPEVVFEDAAGQRIGWAELREGKPHLLAVFLLPNCSLSKYSAELVSDLQAQYEDSVAFVGLAFGTASAADKIKREHALAFEVVGLRTIADPYAGQEFFESVRKAYGSMSGIYGGTIVVLNEQNEMLFGLAEEHVKELPERLAALL